MEDVYEENNLDFQLDHAVSVKDGEDVLIVACGEMVKAAKDAAYKLEEEGIHVAVLDMYCLKPFDEKTLVEKAKKVKIVVTVEEHAPMGGLGSMTAQTISRECPKKVIQMALPDAPVVSGTSKEVFDHYALNEEGIISKIKELLA